MALTLLLEVCLFIFVVLRTWIYSASDLLLILSVDSLASAVYGDAIFLFINMFVVKMSITIGFEQISLHFSYKNHKYLYAIEI